MTVFVPGRIEVLGKHTDYAGGSSLLAAVERGFTFDAEPLADDRIVIVSEDSEEEAGYTIVRGAKGPRAMADSADGLEAAGFPLVSKMPRRAGAPPASKMGRPAGRSHGGLSRPGWARYVDGVLDRTLAEFGEAARGASIRFRSDLPVAAGLSSSSALVCGVFLALDAVCRFSALPLFRRTLPDRQALADWLSAAEMGGPVGTRGGSEDHVAILCAEAGRIVRYALAPIRYRGAAPVPAGWTFAIGASGVVADKGGAVQAHYNRLSDLATRAAEAWVAGARSFRSAASGRLRSDAESQGRRAGTGDAAAEARRTSSPERPGIDGAATSDHGAASESLSHTGGTSPASGGRASSRQTGVNLGDALERAGDAAVLLAGIRSGADLLGEDAAPLVRRARHFVEECALVDAACDALERGDIAAFATAANRSAAVGAELLENQVPETLGLAQFARELGAPAASPFGGGFGGAVWALVRHASADRFLTRWRERYRAAFPERSGAQFFTTRAGGPAATIDAE